MLYIAKEGLKAPLPEPWKPCQTREGEIYYYNFQSHESTWEHPCDEYYKQMFLKEKEIIKEMFNLYRLKIIKINEKKESSFVS